MIIFGTRSKLLNSTTEPPVGDCDYCGNRQSLFAYKQIKYVHIFWIPMFPYGSTVMTACAHCKKVNDQREIDPRTLTTIRADGLPKTSIGYYAGLILLSLVVGAAVIAGISESKQTDSYLQSPRVGDLYEIKYKVDEKPRYTLYRITDLTTDSIQFEINDYEVERSAGLHKLRSQHANSYSEHIMLAKQEVIAMKKNGQIAGIDR